MNRNLIREHLAAFSKWSIDQTAKGILFDSKSTLSYFRYYLRHHNVDTTQWSWDEVAEEMEAKEKEDWLRMQAFLNSWQAKLKKFSTSL